MNYPRFIEVNNKKYKINTNFKIAIKCNAIAEDESIGELESIMAIVYLLFGDAALDDIDKDFNLLNDFYIMAEKYLLCGEEKKKTNKKPDMDYVQDYGLIRTSFRSDYGINIDKEDLHWWEFYDMINGLSDSEFGNCCVLNRIRNLRNTDLSKIKDDKERNRIKEAQQRFELKKNSKKSKMTNKQKESAEEFYRLINRRKE